MTSLAERITLPPRVPGWLMWAESVLVALTPFALGLCFRAEDPLFLQATFFWPALAPLAVALRYGLLPGMVSAACVTAVTLGGSDHHETGERLVGLLLLTLLAGEFCERWQRRATRAEQVGQHHLQRAGEFLRAYHLLTASHAQLERQLRSTTTLRDTLARFKRRVVTASAEPEAQLSLAREVLDLLAMQTGAQMLAYHPVASSRLQPALVTRGRVALTDPRHPLLEEALQTRSVVSLPLDELPEPGAPQIAVPLVDVTEQLIGVVAIHELPVTALREETLQLLAVLGGAIADVLSTFRRRSPQDEAAWFRHELRRSLSDRERHQLPAAIVRFTTDRDTPHFDLLPGERRVLDSAWLTQDAEGNRVLAFLLPLTELEGARAMLDRLERRGRNEPFWTSVRGEVRSIREGDTETSLVHFIVGESGHATGVLRSSSA